MSDLLDLPVKALPVGTRWVTACEPRNENIPTVRALIGHTERELARIPFIGKKSLDELKVALESVGLSLREPDKRDGTLPLPFPSMHERLTRIEQRLDAIERSLQIHAEHGILREVGDMRRFGDKP